MKENKTNNGFNATKKGKTMKMNKELINSGIITSRSGGYIQIDHCMFEDANMKDVDRFNVFSNKTDIYITDLDEEEFKKNGIEVDFDGVCSRNFAGSFDDICLLDFFEDANPFGDECNINVYDHIINISLR